MLVSVYPDVVQSSDGLRHYTGNNDRCYFRLNPHLRPLPPPLLYRRSSRSLGSEIIGNVSMLMRTAGNFPDIRLNDGALWSFVTVRRRLR